MPHKIFLSHNHKDKPVVEPVAVRLAGIFGQDQVFYDAWSIKPGDSIIEQMNKGLEAPEFVFFFVTANSLNSGMVKLEWQNALYAASAGKTRIVPIRVDGTAMPAILMQTLYIDMHTIGLEAAIAQIVAVAQGNASFTPQHEGFSNLSFSTANDNGVLVVTIKASHFMEPNPNFMLLFSNPQSEIGFLPLGAPGYTGQFVPDVKLDNGDTLNGQVMKPINTTLTPAHPVRLQLSPVGGASINFKGLLHQASETVWKAVPFAN